MFKEKDIRVPPMPALNCAINALSMNWFQESLVESYPTCALKLLIERIH